MKKPASWAGNVYYQQQLTASLGGNNNVDNN